MPILLPALIVNLLESYTVVPVNTKLPLTVIWSSTYNSLKEPLALFALSAEETLTDGAYIAVLAITIFVYVFPVTDKIEVLTAILACKLFDVTL